MNRSRPPKRFRWRYQDDVVGEEWSGWHTFAETCPACCHGAPRDGVHQQAAGYYDENRIMDWYAHTTCDPDDLDEWTRVEWRTDPEPSNGTP
jgi:hypothetical protein